MREISKEYLLLFNALTDTEEALSRLRNELLSVQQQAEELYLSGSDDEDEPLPT